MCCNLFLHPFYIFCSTPTTTTTKKEEDRNRMERKGKEVRNFKTETENTNEEGKRYL